MGVFNLKFRDTLPVLEVQLLGADGAAHDLTDAVGVHLHVLLSNGDLVEREMEVADAATGTVRYQWEDADWEDGGLTVGPALPLTRGVREHRMEYEVRGPGDARFTFPNDGYDTLRVVADLGQSS